MPTPRLAQAQIDALSERELRNLVTDIAEGFFEWSSDDLSEVTARQIVNAIGSIIHIHGITEQGD